MGSDTGISWTDATWSPARGCSRVSEGCRNCYAERIAARFSKPGQPFHGFAQVVAPRDHMDAVGGRRNGWTRKVEFQPDQLEIPVRWRKGRRIFCSSMTDIFHEALTNEQIAAVFGVMATCPQHTFQVLTKRAKRMREWFAWLDAQNDGQRFLHPMLAHHAATLANSDRLFRAANACSGRSTWPLPNVWLGVSVENKEARARLDDLRACPAAVRMISFEPLLEDLGDVDLTGMGWAIAGCESGPGARPCDVEWLRSLRDQCAAAEVPFFLKQAKYAVDHSDATRGAVCFGAGSHEKSGGVIELPYLDGVKHAAFPGAAQ